MADKKTEIKIDKLEREYTIPLREKCRSVPRYKKTNKAIRTVKEFLVRHMKIRDRDLNKIKLDKYLNEVIWSRGIRHPPAKIKVIAIKESEDIVRVTLAEMPDKIKFKKEKEEKREIKATAVKKAKPVERKTDIQESEDGAKTPLGVPQNTELRGKEEKEKKSAVVEAGAMMEKAEAKKSKHIVGGKTKEPKHQKRMALAK